MKFTNIEAYFHSERTFVAEIYDFETASEFLDALRLTNPTWKLSSNSEDKEWTRNWLFRGQSNYQWRLIPKSWRSDVLLPQRRNSQPQWFTLFEKARIAHNFSKDYPDFELYLPKLLAQSFNEIDAIIQFSQKADELGFAMPSVNNLVKRLMDKQKDFEGKFWEAYMNSLISNTLSDYWGEPLVALAQHHGIPTRLLDWTKNPFYAAFFAAEDFVIQSLQPNNSIDMIAVYAIAEFPDYIHIVNQDYNMNLFLKSQKGVFTFDSNADAYFLKFGRFPSLEESLREYQGKYNAKVFLLASSQVSELLRLLSLEGITRADLMPVLDNVTRTLQVKWRINLDS